jgi:hypothetical protein
LLSPLLCPMMHRPALCCLSSGSCSGDERKTTLRMAAGCRILLTHPPGSPSPPEKMQAPTMTQPPLPALSENGSTINSPAPPDRQPATPINFNYAVHIVYINTINATIARMIRPTQWLGMHVCGLATQVRAHIPRILTSEGAPLWWVWSTLVRMGFGVAHRYD